MKNILLSLVLGLALFGCKEDKEVKPEKTEIVRVYFKVEATTSLSFTTYYVHPNGVEGQRTSLSTFPGYQYLGVDIDNDKDFGYTLQKDDKADNSFVRVTIVFNDKEQAKSTTGNTLSDVYKVVKYSGF